MNRIDIFLQFLSFVYLSAFSSLLIQSKGLYGNNGILPTRIIVANNPDLFMRYLFPGTSSHFEDVSLLIIIGVIISSAAFILQSFQSKFVFLSLWILYFSIYQIGQTFLWFQWDILLLETGAIAVIIARKWFYGSSSDEHEMHSSSLGFWLVKWLIFRFMFASGVVKLLSDCPAWWGLTALNWHYESQCIPTALAWFAHQLPEWFQKLSVVGTFVIEIIIPILFFVPISTLQWFSFYSQLLFQMAIILSGNYNFFNILTVGLCFAIVPRISRPNKSENQKFVNKFKQIIEEFIAMGVIGIVIWQSISYFGLQVNVKKILISSTIKFSRKDFQKFLQLFVPITIYVGILSLFYEILRYCCITLYIKGLKDKIRHLVGIAATAVIVIAIFLASLVPYTQIDDNTAQKLPNNIKELYNSVNKYEIVNSYGLFRRMTGIGGRPEIVIEGSNSVYGPWKEYEFLYKPGTISRPPPFIIPHQPRLDWQMWFAALGSYQQNPWLINLLYRFLTNESSVIELLSHNPFPDSPPNFVRVQKYQYTYTHLNSGDKNWWKREFISEYLPPISLENDGLINYIKKNNIHYKEQPYERGMVTRTVKWVMDNIDQSKGHYFVWVVIACNLATKIGLKISNSI